MNIVRVLLDNILETESVSSSGKEKETPTLFRLLERANINHWKNMNSSNGPNRVGVFFPLPEDGK
jgi:hypothetical protein